MSERQVASTLVTSCRTNFFKRFSSLEKATKNLQNRRCSSACSRVYFIHQVAEQLVVTADSLFGSHIGSCIRCRSPPLLAADCPKVRMGGYLANRKVASRMLAGHDNCCKFSAVDGPGNRDTSL